MAIGVVTDEEFEAELASFNSSKPIKTEVIHIEKPSPGRNNGDNNVPESLRKIIQEDAISGTSPKQISQAFGISPSSISAYKHGATSTASYNSPNPDLKKSGDGIRLRIASNAKSKILAAMKQITDDKLERAKARDLAGIAKDMSAVVKNMEPDSASGGSSQNNFVFFAPRTKNEDDYEIIHVNHP